MMSDDISLLAYRRIVDKLRCLGIFQPIDEILAEHAATSCAFYLKLARGHYRPTDVEQARLIARRWLAEMLFIPPGREHVALLNDDGLDAVIVELCEQC